MAKPEILTTQELIEKTRAVPNFVPPPTEFPDTINDDQMFKLMNRQREVDYFEERFKEGSFRQMLVPGKEKSPVVNAIRSTFGIDASTQARDFMTRLSDNFNPFTDSTDVRKAKAVHRAAVNDIRDERYNERVQEEMEQKLQRSIDSGMTFEEARKGSSLSTEELIDINKDVNYAMRKVITREPTFVELMTPFFLPFIAEGLLAHTAVTALALGTFAAIDEIESSAIAMMKGQEDILFQGLNAADLLPENASLASEGIIDTLDFASKIFIVHGLGKTKLGEMLTGKAGKIDAAVQNKIDRSVEKFWEATTKDVIDRYKLPQKVYIPGNKVVRLFHPGKGVEISPAEAELVRGLGLDGRGYKQAFKEGVDIEIPAERIVTIADKPYFQKIKKAFKIRPRSETRVIKAGEPKQSIRGLLETKFTPEEIAKQPAFTERETLKLAEVKAENLTIDVKEQILDKIEFVDQQKAEIEANPNMEKERIATKQEIIEKETKAIDKIVEETPEAKVEEISEEAVEEFLPAPEKVDIPTFKNTEDAEVFGKQASAVEIKALETEKVVLQKEFDRLETEGKETEAFALATGQKQFVNEALKVVKKKPEFLEELKPGQISKLKGKIEDAGKALSKRDFPFEATTSAGEKVEVLGQADNIEPFKAIRKKAAAPKDPTRLVVRDIDGTRQIRNAAELIDPATGEPLVPKLPPKAPKVSAPRKAAKPLPEGKVFRKNTKNLKKSKNNKPFAGVWNNKVEIEVGSELYNKLKPVEFPELVLLSKDLMGKVPRVKKLGKSLGQFSIKFTLESVVESIKTGKDVRQVDEINISLIPEIFERGNEQQLAIILAHEIGHLIDYLPGDILQRGNLLGRLVRIKGFLKETYGDIKVKNSEIRDELIKNTQILHPFDPSIDPNYTAYRMSASELYAEAISMLLNSPGTIERVAPKFTKLFFETLDLKPDVKNAFFEMQELLSGKPEAVLARRQSSIREAFVKAENLRKQLATKKKGIAGSTWELLEFYFSDINAPVLRKLQDAESKGQILPPEDNPIYELQELSMVDAEGFLMVSDIDARVMEPLKDQGISMLDLGEYLFLKRVVGRPDLNVDDFKGMFEDYDPAERKAVQDFIQRMVDQGLNDRKDLANPFGFAPETATRQLDFLKEQLGKERFKLMEEKAQIYHDIIYRTVEEAVRVGTYNEKVFKAKIEPNKDLYVTFGVLNYLQQFVPAGVKLQKGTLADIESPFVTTILKMISLSRWNAKNRALNSIRNSFLKKFPDEFVKVKQVRLEGGVPIQPKAAPGKDLVVIYEDGKPVFYEVDAYIADSISRSKVGDIQAVAMLNDVLGNEIFKNIFITYNPGFALAFNPIRDFKRTFKNLNALGVKITVKQLIVKWVQTLPQAVRRQQGITEGTVREMLENKAFDKPFIDFSFHPDADPLTKTLKELDILKGKSVEPQSVKRKMLKIALKPFEAMRFVGSAIESTTKIAGYELLDERKLSDKQKAYITRNFIGTPPFREGGKFTRITNSIWMFSNIFLQGIKFDSQIATRPSTRSGWWWANMKMDLLPKLMMRFAQGGLLGLALKSYYDDVSEYDKTNYLIVPMGRADDGRPVYMRFPHDETSRMVAGMFWKVSGALETGEVEGLSQILDFGAGQMPNYAPALKLGSKWLDFARGQNPRDPFRQRDILSQTAYDAGGLPAIKEMGRWSIDNSGLGQYIIRNDSRDGWFEAAVRHTPPINRLIRISDFGLVEQLRKFREEEVKESAKLTLQKRDAYDSNFERVTKKGEDFNKVFEDVKLEIYGKTDIPRKDARNVKAGFTKKILRDENNPFINAIIGARSNDNKVNILQEMRLIKSPQEYTETLNRLKELKIISDNVLRRALLIEEPRGSTP